VDFVHPSNEFFFVYELTQKPNWSSIHLHCVLPLEERTNNMSHTTLQQPILGKLLAPKLLHRLVRSPVGRAFVLNQAAIAEASDEGQIFDNLLTHVDDEELRKLVRIHAADEVRHAELFAEAAANVGVPIPEVPEHLRLLDRIDRDLGGFFDQFVAGQQSVMDVYLLLQVIEERANTQFRLIVKEFHKVDSALGQMLEGIIKDEERHLKYCHAISKRYAPNEGVLQKRLAELRLAEAQSFGDHTRAVLKHCLDEKLLDIPMYEEPFWRAMYQLGMRAAPPVPSDYMPKPTTAIGGFMHSFVNKVQEARML
jgi:rubrerythrin